jgi:hypothetical protein
MKPFRRGWLRPCILAALLLPCGAMWFLGSSQAQGPFRPPVPGPPTLRPPTFPNNPLNPNPNGGMGPRFERVWKCSRCGGELGRGLRPPDRCPHCGARIINGVPNGPLTGDRPGPNPPAANPNGPRDQILIPNGPPANGADPKPTEKKADAVPNDVGKGDVKPQGAGPVVETQISSGGSASSPSSNSGDGPGAVPFVIGGIVLGLVLLGTAMVLVLRNMRQPGPDAYDPEPYRETRRRRPAHY